MRKLGDALLIVPALFLLGLGILGGHVRRRPVIGVVAIVAIGTLALAAFGRPLPGAATQPTAVRPVSAELLATVRTGHELDAPFTVSFDTPMDAATVAAALRISPDAAVTFAWDAAGTTLTITPVKGWAEGTLYTITIDVSARGTDGAKLSAPVRAVVLTAGKAVGSIAATSMAGKLARMDTEFAITLDHDTTVAAVRAALRTTPALAGTVTATGATGEFVFTPDDSLAAGTTYTLELHDLKDINGLPFDPAPTLTVSTASSPELVRFRPKDGTKDVARGSALSVRFTAPMDRTSTVRALTVTANGKAVKGKVSWAEKDKVLIFTPAAALAYKATVVISVADTAKSKAGAPLDAAGHGTFTVAAKPKVTVVSIPKGGGGGGALAGTWGAVEAYYLKLMNCTRQGGIVTSSGSCASPGGRTINALVINPQISARVSRPYAKLLAARGLCNHYYDGNPGQRLARAGFTSYRWAENIGCSDAKPYTAMIQDQRWFQAEGYGGGHYRNLMHPGFTEVGIGVWIIHGRCRLVVDFYHP